MWLVIVAAYWLTARSLPAKWYESDTFAHGFLVVPVSAYLIWTRRAQWLAQVPAVDWRAAPVLLAAGLGWLAGSLADVLVVQQLALIIMLQCIAWFMLGMAVTKTLRFPLAFLFFAVPFGAFLVPPLQDFTGWFAVGGLRLSGVPVFAEGRHIVTPSNNWHVAEACSGVRYIIASLVLGTLFASVTYRSWRRRLALIGFSAVVPVLANGVRAYGVIMLAHLSDNRLAVGVDHLLYGWLFFGLVMLVLFTLGMRWREGAEAAAVGAQPVAPDAAREGLAPGTRPLGGPPPSVAAALAIVALVLAPRVLEATIFSSPAPPIVRATAPAVGSDWRRVDTATTWKPVFVGADAEIAQAYAQDDRHVFLYLAYYAHERQGAELVGNRNRFFDEKRWAVVARRRIMASNGSEPLEVEETHLRGGRGESYLVWSWYWIAGGHTVRSGTAKLMRLRARVLRDPSGAAAVALATRSDDPQKARATLKQFAGQMPDFAKTTLSWRP